jgi:hypothetical protein
MPLLVMLFRRAWEIAARAWGQMTDRDIDLGYGRGWAVDSVAALRGFLGKERPLTLLLSLSFLAGCVFCLRVFDIDFLLGTSAYWQSPHGVVKGSWADLSTALSGYLFYQRDTWQWPIFHVAKLGVPTGTNIIFTDSVPWVALAGRIAFRLTGIQVILYGAWTAFCFIGSAMSLTALVAALGQRNLVTTAMSTTAGLCMPALLARWGHMSLMAQFEIPLALVFYLHNHHASKAWPLFLQGTGLMWLALWSHTYLFPMVGAIVLATVGQAVSNRALRGTVALSVLIGMVLVIGLVIVPSGYLQSGGELGALGVGYYSMNLLSPVVPQYSGLGLFPRLRHAMVDVTGGQYEGFNYLGFGVLMLLWMTLPWQIRTLRTGLRRHPWISALFIGFTIFALSNVIYLGPVMLLHYPLPDRVMQLASIFRSTGRFFWPVTYGITALAIAGPLALYRRYGTLLLCLAIPLQWLDSEPLRQFLADTTRAPQKLHIDSSAWRATMSRHNSVRVLPQFLCLLRPVSWNGDVTIQLELLAAYTNRPINTVYTARSAADCHADRLIGGTAQTATSQLTVFLDEFSAFARIQRLTATSNVCSAGPGLVVCSDIPQEAGNLVALARTDRK